MLVVVVVVFVFLCMCPVELDEAFVVCPGSVELKMSLSLFFSFIACHKLSPSGGHGM